MRSIALWLVLWLCRVFALNPVSDARHMAGSDAVARGARWEDFYREQGGLKDMLASLRLGYFEAAAGLSVSDTGKLYEFALADRLARELEREVLQVIVTGKARAERTRAEAREQSARLPALSF
jgi:hypothetical protein